MTFYYINRRWLRVMAITIDWLYCKDKTDKCKRNVRNSWFTV